LPAQVLKADRAKIAAQSGLLTLGTSAEGDQLKKAQQAIKGYQADALASSRRLLELEGTVASLQAEMHPVRKSNSFLSMFSDFCSPLER